MDVNTETMSLIGHELADINIARTMPKYALAVRLIIQPLTLVDCPAPPLVYSVALPHEVFFLGQGLGGGGLDL